MYRRWQCHHALDVHIPGSRCRQNYERHCRSCTTQFPQFVVHANIYVC